MGIRVPPLDIPHGSDFGTLSTSMIARRTWRRFQERAIEKALLLAALASIAITAGIVGLLVYESLVFFQSVSIIEFFTDTQWTAFCRS
jgi:phosphate transport system permease protein